MPNPRMFHIFPFLLLYALLPIQGCSSLQQALLPSPAPVVETSLEPVHASLMQPSPPLTPNPDFSAGASTEPVTNSSIQAIEVVQSENEKSVAEELTPPEPEETVEEELKQLEALGPWEEGTPEEVNIEAEVVYDFPVTINKQVEFYLDFFQNKHRKSFTRWLIRSGKYLPMIQRHLEEAGLPLD
ncbi:hypothetical protein ACFL6N_02235, partial [Thermodesulfobacteriota bacterium]